MENNLNSKIADNQKPTKIHKEIRSVYKGQQLNKNESFDKREKDLNSKIMEITMVIKEQHPELLEYLNEMPETIPTEKNPEITLKNLSAYYNSLNAVLNKYKIGTSHSRKLKY